MKYLRARIYKILCYAFLNLSQVAKWRARQKNRRSLKLYFYDFFSYQKILNLKICIFGNFIKNKCVLTEIEKSGHV